MRPVELYVLFIYLSLEHCFPDASIPENMCKTQTLLKDPHQVLLKLGEPKDIHICKRQPCAATVSSGFICHPVTELNLQPRGEERTPSSACRIICRYCGVLRAVLGSA